jgi:NAD(P)-dependent dehydrogenase (short-subunit alcohol dehydrogenase family)
MGSHNKVALVTGAGTGIGKAAALALLKDGYRVALVGRRKDLLDKTVADAGAAGKQALVVPADIGKPDCFQAQHLLPVRHERHRAHRQPHE